MKTTLLCKQLQFFLFFIAVHAIYTESRLANFTVQSISPNSSHVARGEPLLLNVTIRGRLYNKRYTRIRWYFRSFFSTYYRQILGLHIFRGKLVYFIASYDARFSIVNQASLLLVNTTMNDSGTYKCVVKSTQREYPLHFNATIEDEPKAEITCSQKVKLTEKDDFSCWCKATGTDLVTTASWVKNGSTLSNRKSLGQELSLFNVSKSDAGTYICRVQHYSLINEKSTEITVYSIKKQCSQSFNKRTGTEWYIVFISVIIGTISGFVSLYGCQRIRRRKASAATQLKRQITASIICTEPTTSQEYQELSVVRANEENIYQHLRLTTTMK